MSFSAAPHTSPASYDDLVAHHRPAFARLALRLTRNRDDAEDLLQETLLDAYRAFHQYQGGTRFYHWVARIMTRNHLDRFRRKRLTVVPLIQRADDGSEEILDVADDRADPALRLLAATLDAPAQAALDALAPGPRTTVELCDLGGATYEEAAHAQDCPVGTIRSRLHRAHLAIRKVWETMQAADGVSSSGPTRHHSRRAFLGYSAAAAAGASLTAPRECGADASAPVRVFIRVPGAGEQAENLKRLLTIAFEEDAGLHLQFLSDGELSATLAAGSGVLVWCGSDADCALPSALLQSVARQIRDGRLGLVLLQYAGGSPLLEPLFPPDALWGHTTGDAPALLTVSASAPRHPIARGVGPFQLHEVGRAGSALTTPLPDLRVFESEQEGTDARDPEGLVWRVGRGRVFFFRPQLNSGAVLEREPIRRILRNAARWCGATVSTD